MDIFSSMIFHIPVLRSESFKWVEVKESTSTEDTNITRISRDILINSVKQTEIMEEIARLQSKLNMYMDFSFYKMLSKLRIKCGACGQIGHNRANRKCSEYW